MNKNPTNSVNVICVHAHDMGRYNEPYGYKIRTQNIQNFAEEATLFRDAHCAAPTCSPSRAAMLTGETAHQAGMLGLLHRGFCLKDYKRHLAYYLKENGYNTAMSGIQHECTRDELTEIYNHSLSPEEKDFDHADRYTCEKAAEFIKSQKDEENPFFLWVGLLYPHRPFTKLTDNKPNPNYITPPAPIPDTPQTREDMAEYCASVSIVDESFGVLIQALKDNNLYDNSVIVLTTDHGVAFPKMKCNLTQHGTGVSLMIKSPNNPSAGKCVDSLVSHLDLYPTICELLELDKPEWLIGKSLLPLMNEETEIINSDIFSEVNYHACLEPMRSVRTKRFNFIKIFDKNLSIPLDNIDNSLSKSLLTESGLIDSCKKEEIQLFDLYMDPYESNNLAKDPNYQEALKDMDIRMNRWLKETNDPILDGPLVAPDGAKINKREN